MPCCSRRSRPRGGLYRRARASPSTGRNSSKVEEASTPSAICCRTASLPWRGDVIHQPELGQTLRAIAKEGRDAFYKGAIAEDMVETLRGIGGLHTLDDFAAHNTETRADRHDVQGPDVWQCPPNGPGITMLVMLNILSQLRSRRNSRHERRALPSRSRGRADRLHDARAVSAIRPCQRRCRPDPRQEFADEIGGRIRMDRMLDLPNVAPPMNPSTVYITVVDKDRNVCSFINSIAHSLVRRSCRTRPASCCRTVAAASASSPAIPIASRRESGRCTPSFRALVTKDGRAVMPFGVMGGHTSRSARPTC